jgi:hypothetical protein
MSLFVDSKTYEEMRGWHAQKQRELRDISLRIAGKSPSLRDESVTELADDLSARSPIHTRRWFGTSIYPVGFGTRRE